jgi:Rieske Fe-S protein
MKREIIPTRRAFIVWWMGGLLTATVAASAAPLIVYLVPPSGQNGPRTFVNVVLDTPVENVPDGGAVQFVSPPNFGFVLADGGGVNSAGDFTFGGFLTKVRGQLHMLAIKCPHLGCSYALDTPPTRFLCPCHGSQFDLTGKVLHGPAVNPLSHLTWRPSDQPNEVLIEGLKAQ